MLDPDLDLEADLGIDTVKQAEMFAAIRERYGIDRDDTLKLRDYPTLRHVVGFVEDRTAATARTRPPAGAGAPPTRARRHRRRPSPRRRGRAATEEITAAVLEIVAAQTGYPADMLDPDLDLEADLGIDTVKQAEMFAAIRERYGIDRDDTLKLRDYPTLRHVVGFVEDRTAHPAPPSRDAGTADPRRRRPPSPRRNRRVPAPGAGAGAAAAARRSASPTGIDARRGQPRRSSPPTAAASARRSPTRLRKLGVEVCRRPGAATRRGSSPSGPRPARPRRLLAARARRRGRARRARRRRAGDAGLRRARQAASPSLMRDAARDRHASCRRHAPRRPPRLRRRRARRP